MDNKKVLKIKKLSGASTDAPQMTPQPKADGVSSFPDDLAATLTDLNRIFDTHAFKYGDRIMWRMGIIEHLAAWKLGIPFTPTFPVKNGVKK